MAKEPSEQKSSMADLQGEEKSAQARFGLRPDRPTTWVDHSRMSFRKADRLVLLSLFQDIVGVPDHMEVIRVMMTREHAEKLADLICKLLEYTPNPETADVVEPKPIAEDKTAKEGSDDKNK